MTAETAKLDVQESPSVADVVGETSHTPQTELRLSEEQLVEFLKQLTSKRGQVTAMAAIWGINNSELSKVLRGLQGPGPKLLNALNARKETVYVMTVEASHGSQPGA